MNRRDFARLLAIGGAAPFLTPSAAWPRSLDLPPTPASPDEKFWMSVRDQFVMPKELTMLNAANLCPSSGPVLETMYKLTKDMDQDPSQDNRAKLGDGRENTRKLLAEFLRVTAEEIVITRNTSESNNLVSTGIDLKAGDEVLLTADNHPSNHTAWQEKAKRFGFTVKDVPTPNPHPGMEHYVDAFAKAMTPRTKVISFTHQTSTVGDLFPAKALCALARERGILSLVDGAQSFGLMDVDLSDIQPDFYSGSAHKWICGPKENGVLYINKSAQSRIWPSIFSAYPGRVGVSKTFEGFGQR
ncbi:MAG TPA: aminotransferase class V-fold PLP-dependent enzyme, partial [Vicinamibacterales bacterium]|nr:aminotransferase class V-fold PLP-dependent enzyme [Vicinamibacterales bacterium]